MIYEPFSVIAVPFPFTDSHHRKKRPAVVICNQKHQKETNHVTLLMITSAKNSSWESDHVILSLHETGLNAPSIIRQKIFTLDKRLIIKSLGKLSTKDQKEIIKKLSAHLSMERRANS